MRVSIIAAVAENGVIGRESDLPWRLSADLLRFKELTTGHHLIVGRRTWESIGRPLPGRAMIVVSRDHRYVAPGCEVTTSLDSALDRARARGEDEAFVGGGGELYRMAMPVADRIYLTEVHARVDGDVEFPPLSSMAWREISRQCHGADHRNQYGFDFVVLERV